MLTTAKKSIIVDINIEFARFLYFVGVIFLNDRPNRATPEGQPEGNPLGEIREGFDEIYGNIEGFSKRAVGSLFDDDEKKSEPKDIMDDAPKPRHSTRPSRPDRAESSSVPDRPDKFDRPDRSVRPERFDRPESPDETYERYIRSAEKANRAEEDKRRASKEQALFERDRKLGEVSYLSKTRDESKSKARAMEETDLYMSKNRGGGRQINIRNIAAVAIFFMLIVCVVLTWQMLSARAELSAMLEDNERVIELEQENSSLRIENNGQASTISQLNMQIEDLEERLDAWESIFGTGASADAAAPNGDSDTDAPGSDNGAAAQAPSQPVAGDLPYTTRNAAGERVYTFQQGDTLWSVAVRVYGNGGRFHDILRANNLTEAQASVLPPGTILIIPD